MIGSADSQFLMFAATVAVVRLWLFVLPIPGPTVLGVRIHHYMIGAAGLWIASWMHWPFAVAISLGLVVDELAYLAIGGETHEDNYSVPSLVGTAILVTIVFLLRHLLLRPGQ